VTWAVITGEYPSQTGGVSDYTSQVALALANLGDPVHAFAPPAGNLPQPGVIVHRLPGFFDVASRTTARDLIFGLPEPRRVLLQYVPHAFGYRAMNVRFCRWIRSIARAGIPVDVMFHEVAYPLEPGQPLKHKLLAHVNRKMARWIGDAADRIFISVPAWEATLREIGVTKPTRWLPVPSNISLDADPSAVAAVRSRYGSPLIGHFGTYGPMAAAKLREVCVPLAERDPSRRLLLLGRGATAFAAALEKDFPALAGRVHGPAPMDAAALATHLAACDLLIQAYDDGISTRRSSAMAGLALGVPIVSNVAHSTEALWAQSGAVALSATWSSPDLIATAELLLADAPKLAELRARGRSLYQNRFDLRFTIDALRAAPV